MKLREGRQISSGLLTEKLLRDGPKERRGPSEKAVESWASSDCFRQFSGLHGPNIK
jgi:hypothetical protein